MTANSSPPMRAVPSADGLAQRIGHRLDDQIADRMAVGVVDALEVIDVEQQQQRRLAGTRHAIDLAAQARFEAAAVGQTGQRIAARQVAQRIDQALQPCHAARRARRHRVTRLLQQLHGLLDPQSGGFRRRWGGGCTHAA
jgi:hypothetical protein